MITNNPSNWLNPRRKRNAERILAYLHWHGGKVYLSPDRYTDIQDDTGLDRFAVDQAVNDLYQLGVIDSRFAGETQVLEMLSNDLDGASAASKKNTSTSAKITLSNNKNGAWR